MKWLLEMDEDIRTGFLLGSFLVTLLVFIFIDPMLTLISPIFLILWIYSLIKSDKNSKRKQQNTDSV